MISFIFLITPLWECTPYPVCWAGWDDPPVTLTQATMVPPCKLAVSCPPQRPVNKNEIIFINNRVRIYRHAGELYAFLVINHDTRNIYSYIFPMRIDNKTSYKKIYKLLSYVLTNLCVYHLFEARSQSSPLVLLRQISTFFRTAGWRHRVVKSGLCVTQRWSTARLKTNVNIR